MDHVTRRGFLKATTAVATVAIAGASVKYGRMDVDGHRAHKLKTGEDLHVYFNGVELHKVCVADDVTGYVEVLCGDRAQHRDLFAHGPTHKAHLGHVCKLTAYGHVVMRPGVYR